MTEYPYAKPTTSVQWETAGTPTAPTAERRAAGFELDYSPGYDDVNWLWKERGIHLSWSDESGTPRIFDDLWEAIEEAAPGSLVLMRLDQSWGDAPLEQDTGSGTGVAVSHIAVDGRRVYYIQGTTLYAATANPSGAGAQVEWSASLAAMGTITGIDTDGVIVAVIGSQTTTEATLRIYDAATGSLIATDSAHQRWDLVACDCVGTTRNVWLAAFTVITGLWRWSGAGVIQVVATGASVSSLSVTPERAIIRPPGSTTVSYYTKATTPVLARSLSLSPHSLGITDGRTTYTAASTIVRLGAYGGVYMGYTPGASILASVADDRMLYVALDGSIVAVGGLGFDLLHTYPVTFNATKVATDGRYIWHNGSSAKASSRLEALPIARGHQLWHIKDQGGPGAYTVHRTFLRRAQPLQMGDIG